jgi:hypothetical protein
LWFGSDGLGGRPVVPASLLTYVVVSTLHLPENRDLADVESSDATRFGVTRELETMVPYAVPQVWARAFDAAGIGGVAYGPRFTTGDAVSYAVFGPAGIAPWPVDPKPVRAVDVPGVPVALDPPRRGTSPWSDPRAPGSAERVSETVTSGSRFGSPAAHAPTRGR